MYTKLNDFKEFLKENIKKSTITTPITETTNISNDTTNEDEEDFDSFASELNNILAIGRK